MAWLFFVYFGKLNWVEFISWAFIPPSPPPNHWMSPSMLLTECALRFKYAWPGFTEYKLCLLWTPHWSVFQSAERFQESFCIINDVRPFLTLDRGRIDIHTHRKQIALSSLKKSGVSGWKEFLLFTRLPLWELQFVCVTASHCSAADALCLRVSL